MLNKKTIIIAILFIAGVATLGYVLLGSSNSQLHAERTRYVSEIELDQAKQAEIEMQRQVDQLQKDILNNKK